MVHLRLKLHSTRPGKLVRLVGPVEGWRLFGAGVKIKLEQISAWLTGEFIAKLKTLNTIDVRIALRYFVWNIKTLRLVPIHQ